MQARSFKPKAKIVLVPSVEITEEIPSGLQAVEWPELNTGLKVMAGLEGDWVGLRPHHPCFFLGDFCRSPGSSFFQGGSHLFVSGLLVENPRHRTFHSVPLDTVLSPDPSRTWKLPIGVGPWAWRRGRRAVLCAQGAWSPGQGGSFLPVSTPDLSL